MLERKETRLKIQEFHHVRFALIYSEEKLYFLVSFSKSIQDARTIYKHDKLKTLRSFFPNYSKIWSESVGGVKYAHFEIPSIPEVARQSRAEA